MQTRVSCVSSCIFLCFPAGWHQAGTWPCHCQQRSGSAIKTVWCWLTKPHSCLWHFFPIGASQSFHLLTLVKLFLVRHGRGMCNEELLHPLLQNCKKSQWDRATVLKIFLVALGFAQIFVARKLTDKIMLIKSDSHAQNLSRGLKFEIFSVAEGDIRRSSQYFSRAHCHCPSEQTMNLGQGKMKRFAQGQPAAELRANWAFMSPCSVFCPLPALLLHFPLLFFFHYSVSQTFRLQFWLCPANSIDDLSICICRKSSWRREGVGGPSTRKEEKPKQVSPLPPSHPQNKHNPPGFSCFSICGGKGMIHSFFQDSTGSVWSVCPFSISV